MIHDHCTAARVIQLMALRACDGKTARLLLEQDCTVNGSSGSESNISNTSNISDSSDSSDNSDSFSNSVPALATLRGSDTVVVLLTAGVLDNPKKLVQLAISHR